MNLPVITRKITLRSLVLLLLFASGQAAYAQKGLLAHYKFNKDYTDQSGFGNNGRLVGSRSFVDDRFGNGCSALGLDGSSFVTVPSSRSLNSPTNEITIMAWVQSDFGGMNNPDLMWFTVCSKGTTPTETATVPHYRLQMTSVTLSLNTEFTENLYQYIAPGTWYHCAMVYDGREVVLYLDGNRVFSYPYRGAMRPNSENLDIGRDVPGNREFHYGAIDDLKIYQEALSPKQIQRAYEENSEQGGNGVVCADKPVVIPTPVVVKKVDTVYQDKTVYQNKIDTVYNNQVVYKNKVDTVYQDKVVYKDKVDTVYNDKTIYKDKVDTVYQDKTVYQNRVDTVYKKKTVVIEDVDTVYKKKTVPKIDLSKDAFVLEDVYFRQSRPELLPSSKPSLDELVEVMRQNPTVHIRLEGHTDNVGQSTKNLVLSEKRVTVVQNYLIHHGIDEDRITVKGLGETRPLNDNSTEALRKLNRRVEVKITKR